MNFKLANVLIGLVMFAVSTQLSAQQIASVGVGDLSIRGEQPQSINGDPTLVALRDSLNRTLQDTRKFTVISYQQMVNQLAKQGLTLDGFKDPAYQAAEKDQVGFDYILTANIAEYAMLESTRGATADKIAVVVLDFALTGVADVTDNRKSTVSAQSSVTVPLGGSVDESSVISRALNGAVEKAVLEISASLHPIRIMIIDDNDEITLNYGTGVLKAGDSVWVYPEDFDPDNPASAPVAQLQITSGDKKFVRARALQGIDVLEGREFVLKNTQNIDVSGICQSFNAGTAKDNAGVLANICKAG